MKTIENIRALLYNPADETDFTRPIVSYCADLSGCTTYTYTDEQSLGRLIEECRKAYNPKEVIILKPFRGRLFQMCPGSPDMICCNYRLVNTGFNCLYNCAYCYLQLYLNSYGIQLFSNMDDVYTELDEFIASNERDNSLIYRIGTGEFTDSLMIDHITGIGERLITQCAGDPGIMLELKTKCDRIDHLCSIQNKGNAVIGWSVNTPYNISQYEKGSADLSARLEAASRAVEAGFLTAFHFDPIILHHNWEAEYHRVVDRIFEHVPPSSVAWISMGSFRYLPRFKGVVRQNFPDEKMSAGEFFPGEDGKYRYLWQQRVDIYRSMVRHIRNYSDELFIYMCMESSRMWKVVFDDDFSESKDLEAVFSTAMEELIRKRKDNS